MRASAEGTERYAEQRPEFRAACFYRAVSDLRVSSLGIGTCEEGGPEHRFRFVQLPFNLGIALVAGAALSQTRVLEQLPAGVAELLPGLATDAQRAIQFTRSTPGIAVALENLGIAQVPPAGHRAYMRLYR